MAIKTYVKKHKKAIGIIGVVTGVIAGTAAAIFIRKKKAKPVKSLKPKVAKKPTKKKVVKKKVTPKKKAVKKKVAKKPATKKKSTKKAKK